MSEEFIRMIKSFTLILLLCGVCSGSRILVFYPGVSGSLLLSFNPLFRELSLLGHELTVVTKHPLPGAREHNITEVLIPQKDFLEVYTNFRRMSVIQQIVCGWHHIINECENLFETPEIIDIIFSGKKYDLFIGSPNYYLECSIAVAHHLKLPILNIYSNRFSIQASHPAGHPNPLAYISELHLPFGDDMSLWQRTVNVVFSIGYSIGLEVYYLPHMARVVKKKFPHLPPLQDMLSHAPVTLLNTNLATHHAQPFLPGVIPIAGLTISKNSKLPQDFQDWMDISDDGVILFTLGTNIKISSLNPEVLGEILATFAQLPQKVLMKWEGDQPQGMPINVRTEKWIPQTAVLAHRNCRLFMTHGGLHGWEEAIYFGVPLLGLQPLFFDQIHNLAEMQNRGQGLYFSGPLTQDHLYTAIQEVLHNPKYKENIQKASKVFVDQPMKPLDRAVYWTEYVIRHHGAQHLQSYASTVTWYQLACLDVVSVILLIFGSILWTTWTILQWLRQ